MQVSKGVHCASGPSAFCLVLLLGLPALAGGQQAAEPAGIPVQAVPPGGKPPSAPHDPELVKRPPPAVPRQAGAVTPAGRIHLDVMVTDGAGKAAPGLEPADFQLLDNNQPRKILSFRSFDGAAVKPEPPVEVIFVFDTARSE